MMFVKRAGLNSTIVPPAESLQHPHGPLQGPPIASFPTP